MKPMKNTILIVDDVELNRDILALILKKDYDIEMAEDGEEALEILRQDSDSIAMVLLDVLMPRKSGVEVLREMSEKGYLSKIPVLIISTEDTSQMERECLSLGASDFIRKPFDREIIKTRVKNIADLYIYKNHLEDRIAEQTKIIAKRNSDMIDLIGNMVETRSLESGEHILRVKDFTRILAETLMEEYPEYGLTGELIKVIVAASALHDVGKVAIKDSILLKPARLTPEEFEEIKLHTTIGCDFIKNSCHLWDEEYSKISYEICRYHHERYDGKGYPDGLSEDDIPISAQIVSIADVYDALINERCYKEAFPKNVAFDMIQNGECGAFSPKLLKCFSVCRSRMEAVC